MDNFKYLLSDIKLINKIGPKTAKLLKKKNINTIFDLLLNLPVDKIDRSRTVKVKDLKINQVQSLIVNVKKYNFPRVRNLPNRVNCEDDTGKLDCVFFNSYEGYIKKILPLNKMVTINGKVNYYKGKYQITNPKYVSDDKSKILTINSKYSLTEGITEKKYDYLINEALNNIPDLKEWHSRQVTRKFNNISWKEAILKIHNPDKIKQQNKNVQRLIYDEIFATLLIKSKIRTKLKKIKKIVKIFDSKNHLEIKNLINFQLTNDQIKAINEIQSDLRSNKRMFNNGAKLRRKRLRT